MALNNLKVGQNRCKFKLRFMHYFSQWLANLNKLFSIVLPTGTRRNFRFRFRKSKFRGFLGHFDFEKIWRSVSISISNFKISFRLSSVDHSNSVYKTIDDQYFSNFWLPLHYLRYDVFSALRRCEESRNWSLWLFILSIVLQERGISQTQN